MSPRLAGDSDHYSWALLDPDGNPTDYRHELISVTSVIKATLTKGDALIGWAYKTGLEGILQLAEQGASFTGLSYEELKSLLHAHGYSPWGRRDRGGFRGSRVHETLERLARGESLAQVVNTLGEIPAEERGYHEAVLGWWSTNNLQPGSDWCIEVERSVWSFQHGFQGTLDLLYRFTPVWSRLIDLKTAKAVYPEHPVQLGAYKLGLQELGLTVPDECSILLAREDGTWEETVVEPQPEVFLHLLEVYRRLSASEKGE